MYKLESGQWTAVSSRAHQPGSGPLTGQAFSLFSQAYMGGSGAMQIERVRLILVQGDYLREKWEEGGSQSKRKGEQTD